MSTTSPRFGRVFQVTMMGDEEARGNNQRHNETECAQLVGRYGALRIVHHHRTDHGRTLRFPLQHVWHSVGDRHPRQGIQFAGEGIKAMERLVKNTLGNNYSYAWTGEAYQETQSGTTVTAVFIFAIILTLLVLAAQYESWTDPLAVVLAMPVAVLGCVLGCIIVDQSISIYTQIGLILVLGLSAKNAILIVEYATYFRRGGVLIPVRPRMRE